MVNGRHGHNAPQKGQQGFQRAPSIGVDAPTPQHPASVAGQAPTMAPERTPMRDAAIMSPAPTTEDLPDDIQEAMWRMDRALFRLTRRRDSDDDDSREVAAVKEASHELEDVLREKFPSADSRELLARMWSFQTITNGGLTGPFGEMERTGPVSYDHIHLPADERDASRARVPFVSDCPECGDRHVVLFTPERIIDMAQRNGVEDSDVDDLFEGYEPHVVDAFTRDQLGCPACL